MGKRVELVGHLESEEIRRRYRGCESPGEKIHWLLIMQLSEGTARSVREGARQSGLDYSWACRLVKRYNQMGPDNRFFKTITALKKKLHRALSLPLRPPGRSQGPLQLALDR